MCSLRNSEPPVTLKEVAEAAGVSVATVSRVINHSGNVSLSTRSRVLSAIKTLNYAPNAYAIQLRGLRHKSAPEAMTPGRDDAPQNGQAARSNLETLKSQNKRLKRAVRTLIRDLQRWQSLAEESIESG
jgi:DNA-binding LacI/PurR family transcriptional regulator